MGPIIWRLQALILDTLIAMEHIAFILCKPPLLKPHTKRRTLYLSVFIASDASMDHLGELHWYSQSHRKGNRDKEGIQ